MTPESAAVILRVSPSAAPNEVRAAYKALARRSHPDRFTDATVEQRAAATAEFIRLTEAYEALMARGSTPPRSAATGARPASAPPSRPSARATADDPRPIPLPDAGRPVGYVSTPVLSPRARAAWRWIIIAAAAALALLFSSNAVGLSPGTFGVPASSPAFVPVMIGAELLCVAAVAACVAFAVTGRVGAARAAIVLTGIVLLAFFAADLLLAASFTISNLFFAVFATAITASPFLALLLIGRVRAERLGLARRYAAGSTRP